MDKSKAELDLRRAEARHDWDGALAALDVLIDASDSPLEIEWLGKSRDDVRERQKQARPIRWWWGTATGGKR